MNLSFLTKILMLSVALLLALLNTVILHTYFVQFGYVIAYPLNFVIGFVVAFYGPRLLDQLFPSPDHKNDDKSVY